MYSKKVVRKLTSPWLVSSFYSFHPPDYTPTYILPHSVLGACDGTGDNTIKNLYLPNEHWRGVFVEPLTMNLRDLIKYMADNNANQRSLIIHAAATSECVKPTLVMERPLYEEKNASIPVSTFSLFICQRLSTCVVTNLPPTSQQPFSTGFADRSAQSCQKIATTHGRNGPPKRCAVSRLPTFCPTGVHRC